jgi:hypothetical protein
MIKKYKFECGFVQVPNAVESFTASLTLFE